LFVKDFSLALEMTIWIFFRVAFCKNTAPAAQIAFYETISLDSGTIL